MSDENAQPKRGVSIEALRNVAHNIRVAAEHGADFAGVRFVDDIQRRMWLGLAENHELAADRIEELETALSAKGPPDPHAGAPDPAAAEAIRADPSPTGGEG